MNTKPILYHGTAKPLQGGALIPRATGRFAQIAPVVFATDDRTQATMFAAFDWTMTNGPVLSGGYGQGAGAVKYVFLPNRQFHMSNPNPGTLLEFPTDNDFVKHDACGPTEWVKFGEVRFANCIQHPVNGIQDLMSTGVQVLFFEPGEISRDRIQELMVPKQGKYYLPDLVIANFIKTGLLVHENAEQGILPHDFRSAALKNLLEVSRVR